MSGWRPKRTSRRRAPRPAPDAGARNPPPANSADSTYRTYSPPFGRLDRTAAYGRVAGRNFKGGAQRRHGATGGGNGLLLSRSGHPRSVATARPIGRKRRAGGRFSSHHGFTLIFIILHSICRSQTL